MRGGANGGVVRRMFTILGPAAEEIVAEWGEAGQCTQLPAGGHVVVGFEGAPVVVWRSSGLGPHVPGWTFVVADSVAAEFWRKVALQVLLRPHSLHRRLASAVMHARGRAAA